MVDDMVMRSVYLRPGEDTQLRQLAHELKVTKSDLIRSAISVKLMEWLTSEDRERILEDVEHGRRDAAALRTGRGAKSAAALPRPDTALKKAPPKPVAKAATPKPAAKAVTSKRALEDAGG